MKMSSSLSNVIMMYPFACSRCGYCCTVEPCPIAVEMGANRVGKCCFLDIGEGDHASCTLMEISPAFRISMGAGKGCCTAGWVMDARTRKKSWYAGLDPKLKRKAAAANYKTQGCVGRQRWGCPFPDQPHDEEGDSLAEGLHEKRNISVDPRQVKA